MQDTPFLSFLLHGLSEGMDSTEFYHCKLSNAFSGAKFGWKHIATFKSMLILSADRETLESSYKAQFFKVKWANLLCGLLFMHHSCWGNYDPCIYIMPFSTIFIYLFVYFVIIRKSHYLWHEIIPGRLCSPLKLFTTSFTSMAQLPSDRIYSSDVHTSLHTALSCRCMVRCPAMASTNISMWGAHWSRSDV